MIMAKVSKVPSGMMTGKDAASRLAISVGTFYKQVRLGKIKKYTVPGSSEGYYSREEIEKMAQAKELFILLYSIKPVIFERASSEEDIKGIVDLTIAIYGIGGTPSFQTRLAIWRKCPDVYYVVKQEGIVVGYISMIWFTDTALAHLMGPTPKQSVQTPAGTGVYSVTGPENMLPFTPGQPIDSIFISLGARPGMSNQQQREYGFKLLRGTLEVLEDFARREMPVRKIYATSEKQDGIQLARKLGMREIKYPGDNLVRFEMDLNTSESSLAADYRERVRSMQQAQASA